MSNNTVDQRAALKDLLNETLAQLTEASRESTRLRAALSSLLFMLEDKQYREAARTIREALRHS